MPVNKIYIHGKIEDILRACIFVCWVFFAFINIFIIVVYRNYDFIGQRLLTPSQIPTLQLIIATSYLPQFITMFLFHFTRREADKNLIGTFMISGLLACSILINLVFFVYVASPMFSPMLDGDDLIKLYGEASSIFGLINMMLVTPLTGYVFSAK